MKHADAWEELEQTLDNRLLKADAALGNVEYGGRLYGIIKAERAELRAIISIMEDLKEEFE